MVEQFANNAAITLTSAIETTTATTIKVLSAAGFPTSTRYRALVGSELLIVTGGAATTSWIVTRGAESTVAATHANGATVTHVLTAGALAQLKTDANPSSADVTWTIIQASQLVNEVMNFPSYGGIDEDLDALSLWWDKVGTPSTAVTMVDVAGEGGITETWEYALKTVADAAGEGF
ncbi:MAG: hypothetical protein M0R22_08150, partial [Dehalococcoidia bacterium]|nr:hypothetical protein [Dehalococcoidia bacterium]